MSEKLYYKSAYIKEFDAKVISCEKSEKSFAVILDKTAFYPEGGGQPCDLGTINGIKVVDVQEKDEEVVHYTTEEIPEGKEVHGVIDWARRYDLMVQHSGEHLVSGFINRRFGYNNVGFHIGGEMITIDLDGEITKEELHEIEVQTNDYIWENHKTEILYPTPEELETLQYRSKKELSGEVRIVRFPGGDTCACCGTHVDTTAEIGFVKLISIQKFHEGVRIEMLSGKRAYEYIAKAVEENSKISALLSAKVFETAAAVERLLDENQNLKIKVSAAENSVINIIADNYKGIDTTTIINQPDFTPDNVRKLAAALIEQNSGMCCVFSGDDENGYKYAVAQKDGDLKALVKDMNAALNGRGGGKPFFAQGSVNAKWTDIEEFFKDK
ncbi:MAG: alanyl-tRNA editing protein [Firmicutes bacterium]|nr:alanyl-tRNA editing protein [Bacillota bacterium]